MANHRSAEKRARQTINKSKVNQILLSKIKKSFNKLNHDLSEKKIDLIQESFRLFNLNLSKAVKKGVIKKRNASRKLSLLSDKIKKIS